MLWWERNNEKRISTVPYAIRNTYLVALTAIDGPGPMTCCSKKASIAWLRHLQASTPSMPLCLGKVVAQCCSQSKV